VGRSTKQMSITLPIEMAESVKRRVDSGEYASDSEVIRDGLRALDARDAAVEAWLRTEVVDALDALDADPSRSRSSSEVRAALRDAAHRRAGR